MFMISIVHLTSRSPSKLGDELSLAGYRVFEAWRSRKCCLQQAMISLH